VKGLSLLQPWCWLMTEPSTHGVPYKPIENRKWHLPSGMRNVEFAVCASKGTKRSEYNAAEEFAMARGVLVPPVTQIALGVVLGTVRAVECLCPTYREPEAALLLGKLIRRLDLTTMDLDWWMDWQHGHVWRDVRKLTTPIPIKGALGFFALPPEIEAAIREQLPPLSTESR